MTDQVEPHILKRYSLIKKVGSGAYGHVWKVTDKKNGQVLALKKIFDAFQHSTDAQRTYREIVFLHQLNHPNIIKLYNVIKADNDKDLYLVFEYMDADLHNAIGQKILKDAHNRFILYQLVKGLKFMHSAQVIHRDLKPSNLLLNSDCNVKICDFGLARSLAVSKNEQKDIVLTEQVATRWYRAPQVLLGSNFYDKSADIWSIGCILAQTLIGKPIFPGNSTLNQLERILSFTGKPKLEDIQALNSQTAVTMINEVSSKQKPLQQWFKSTVPQEAISLVVAMLAINPKKRPTTQQILKHPYLSSFHKPKQQTISDRIIHPPISDNTKLNLKQYRKLIYERIKKLYSDDEQVTSAQIGKQNISTLQIKKSVQRSIPRQASNTKIQKRYVHSQQNQQIKEKQRVINSNKLQRQKQQRPQTQVITKKNSISNSQVDWAKNNNASIYRNTKTSYSNYVSQKNATRYSSSTSNQKKNTSYSNGIVKHSSSSHHSSSLNQTSNDETEGLKKKNSLKQILKAKRQVGIQSAYNVASYTPTNNASKTQMGYYQPNQNQNIGSSVNSSLKHNTSQSGYTNNPSSTFQSKYQNYTGQSIQYANNNVRSPYQQQYSSYNGVNQSSSTYSPLQNNYNQTHTNGNGSNIPNSSLYKQNKIIY